MPRISDWKSHSPSGSHRKSRFAPAGRHDDQAAGRLVNVHRPRIARARIGFTGTHEPRYQCESAAIAVIRVICANPRYLS
jgi:hypothetical protein